MKKMKIMLGSAVFLTAVVAAFATQKDSGNLLQGFIQTANDCEPRTVPPECGTTYENICTVLGTTYYQNQDPQDPNKCVDLFTKPE